MAPIPRPRLNFPNLVAIVTLGTGLSFATETYSSPASTQPFSLLDGLPGHDGQAWWAYAYVVGGILLAAIGCTVPCPIPARLAVFCTGVAIWGLFGAASAYASLLAPDAGRRGSGWDITSLAMVMALIAAASDTVADPHAHPRQRDPDALWRQVRRGA